MVSPEFGAMDVQSMTNAKIKGLTPTLGVKATFILDEEIMEKGRALVNQKLVWCPRNSAEFGEFRQLARPFKKWKGKCHRCKN